MHRSIVVAGYRGVYGLYCHSATSVITKLQPEFVSECSAGPNIDSEISHSVIRKHCRASVYMYMSASVCTECNSPCMQRSMKTLLYVSYFVYVPTFVPISFRFFSSSPEVEHLNENTLTLDRCL